MCVCVCVCVWKWSVGGVAGGNMTLEVTCQTHVACCGIVSHIDIFTFISQLHFCVTVYM